MRVLAFIGVLAIAVAVAGGVYFFGGFYSVSAADGGSPAVEWTLRNVRMASVNQHADAPGPPAWLDDPRQIQDGAREFAEHGCAHCHGAPGVKPSQMVRGMHPRPPALARVAGHLSNAELFWVVKNGIRMSGMPAFNNMEDAEVWRIVAFVNRMGSVTPMQYERWSAGADGHTHESHEAGGGHGGTGAATPGQRP